MGIFDKMNQVSRNVAESSKSAAETSNLKKKIAYEKERIQEVKMCIRDSLQHCLCFSGSVLSGSRLFLLRLVAGNGHDRYVQLVQQPVFRHHHSDSGTDHAFVQ